MTCVHVCVRARMRARKDTLFFLFRFTASGESSLYSRHREMSAHSDRPARSSRTDVCGTSWAPCSSSSSPHPRASTYARSLPIKRVRSACDGGRGGGCVGAQARRGVLREQNARWIFRLSIATEVQRARLGLCHGNFLLF